MSLSMLVSLQIVEHRLMSGLAQYRNHVSYIRYVARSRHLAAPGAGDLLSDILDVAIVSLAIPMFNYRNELKRHVQSPF
jgi:putative effector of murein hydrolase